MKSLYVLYFIALVKLVKFGNLTNTTDSPQSDKDILLNNTRRIMTGKEAGQTRPYMVYLREVVADGEKSDNPNWICGGVIIDKKHILTSAACIENVQHFIVISGTHQFYGPAVNNLCVKNGLRKAIWKCVPKDYAYDGKDFNNIHWMVGDIAVVKVDQEFDFKRRIKGCDYVPQKLSYNNISADLEARGRVASIAGWGSTEKYLDPDVPSAAREGTGNSPELLEADVQIISKISCKKRWPERYHDIIDNEMICTKDALDVETMKKICQEQHADCKDVDYEDDEDGDQVLRTLDPKQLSVHRPHQQLERQDVIFSSNEWGDGADITLRKRRVLKWRRDGKHGDGKDTDSRRAAKKSKKTAAIKHGGFCENDHGGPLVEGRGKTSRVIGIIAAAQTHKSTMKCFGPFLFTSVYKYRNLISCSIYKDIGSTCRRVLKDSGNEVNYDWNNPKLLLRL